jgi:adenylate cyclase
MTETQFLGPAPEDMDRLDRFLRSLGATPQELAEAAGTKTWGALALDLTLRDGKPSLSIQEAAAVIGAEPEAAAAYLQALGLANSGDQAARISPELAEAQAVVSVGVSDWLGDEVALGIARVIGASTSRLAQAVVDAFRMGFEVPELAAGTSYADVVESYVRLTKESLPPFQAVIGAVLKAHLVRVAGGAWAPDVDAAGARRTLVVGFADLVGYTALSRTLTATELARLLGSFEDTTGDVLARHRGRLVKLIGDGAMFTADNIDDGCALALDLTERFAADEGLPPVRVGLAWGSVLTLYGDYFGAEVNLAARLVALANPGTVVVSEPVSTNAGAEWVFEQLPPQALKGFGAPETVCRLVSPAPA